MENSIKISTDISDDIKIAECYFLLCDNDMHTLHYIVKQVLGDKFTPHEIGEAMKLYMAL
jgi:hypothetical protein